MESDKFQPIANCIVAYSMSCVLFILCRVTYVVLHDGYKMKCLACTKRLTESQVNLPHGTKTDKTRMWANAKRDGHPAEHRWRAPSVRRRKVWLTPTTRCRAVTLPRRETRWNLQGCPKLPDRSQMLVGRSSPYYEDVGDILLLKKFFPIVDMCLSCKDIARRSCAMVPRYAIFCDFFASCICSEPRAAHFRPAF